MTKFLTLFLFLGLTSSVIAQNCNTIPSHFGSYEDAVAFVKRAIFKVKESVNTDRSSWIQSASFYSCDGKVGYFIYSARGTEYIHKGMPIAVWKGFKTANSFGKYYNEYIKHRYRFNL